MADDPNPFAPSQTPVGLSKDELADLDGCLLMWLVNLLPVLGFLFLAWVLAVVIFGSRI